MSYEVKLTQRAEKDIRTVYRWLQRKLPDSANRWYVGLRRDLVSLAHFPLRCPLVQELSDEFPDARQLVCGNPGNLYRVLFRIENEVVFVLRVIHGARAERPFE